MVSLPFAGRPAPVRCYINIMWHYILPKNARHPQLNCASVRRRGVFFHYITHIIFNSCLRCQWLPAKGAQLIEQAMGADECTGTAGKPDFLIRRLLSCSLRFTPHRRSKAKKLLRNLSALPAPRPKIQAKT